MKSMKKKEASLEVVWLEDAVQKIVHVETNNAVGKSAPCHSSPGCNGRSGSTEKFSAPASREHWPCTMKRKKERRRIQEFAGMRVRFYSWRSRAGLCAFLDSPDAQLPCKICRGRSL